jgi:F-type H+-transporting ATPase subunit b
MSFDWFTLVAQLVNFGLLLLLLRLFLYKPVLGVMQKREERLAAAWQEAEAATNAAAEAAAEHRRATGELSRQRQERLALITQEAAELRRSRLAEVELAVTQEHERRLDALASNQQRVAASLTANSARLLLDELRATLADLADAELEEHALARFLQELATLPTASLAELRAGAAQETPVLTTAFELTPELQAQVGAACAELLGAGVTPRFMVEPQLLFGAELTVGALRVEFSGRQRTAALASAFEAALREAATAPAAREQRAY